MAWFNNFFLSRKPHRNTPVPGSPVSVADEYIARHGDLIYQLETRSQSAQPLLVSDVAVTAEVTMFLETKLAEATAREKELVLIEKDLLAQLEASAPTPDELDPPEPKLWAVFQKLYQKLFKRGDSDANPSA